MISIYNYILLLLFIFIYNNCLNYYCNYNIIPNYKMSSDIINYNNIILICYIKSLSQIVLTLNYILVLTLTTKKNIFKLLVIS